MEEEESLLRTEKWNKERYKYTTTAAVASRANINLHALKSSYLF